MLLKGYKLDLTNLSAKFVELKRNNVMSLL
jgi:hypothetical protein